MKKIFPKINFILGNNAVEAKGVKSNYFQTDLNELNKIPSRFIIKPIK